MTSIRAQYDRVVDAALDAAPHVDPIATGLTASIDEIYHVDEHGMVALAKEARRPGTGAGTSLARRIIDRIGAGRGGEIVSIWDDGPSWLTGTLGDPDARLVGGNAAQASWALAMVGAPSVLALRDRSETQLGVLDGRILLAGPDGLSPISSTPPAGSPSKWPHGILEFTAGTPLDGVPIPRSTRVMLRFSHEPLETDPGFLDYCRTADVPVALLSGLATQPNPTTPDVHWAVELGKLLTARGGSVHHEVSEFADPADLRTAIGALPSTSVGMSSSELTMATGRGGDPAQLAADLAISAGRDVIVHADEWSLIVTRDPSPETRDSLILANALAAARARTGRPSESPYVDDTGRFTAELPSSGPVRDGWHAIAVPSPYELRPRGTVGLGDTFVAGLLLGDAIHRTPPPNTRKATS